jgi:hypothetical protein
VAPGSTSGATRSRSSETPRRCITGTSSGASPWTTRQTSIFGLIYSANLGGCANLVYDRLSELQLESGEAKDAIATAAIWTRHAP